MLPICSEQSVQWWILNTSADPIESETALFILVQAQWSTKQLKLLSLIMDHIDKTEFRSEEWSELECLRKMYLVFQARPPFRYTSFLSEQGSTQSLCSSFITGWWELCHVYVI